ncbi:hypothetical protein TNCT6_40030 [Streptomyces sp. 6-11-2]|nr:hypothetical protein TNCT6_40030 [Streptomyces sp. 6-11-2]
MRSAPEAYRHGNGPQRKRGPEEDRGSKAAKEAEGAPARRSPHGPTTRAPSHVPVRIPPTGSGRAFKDQRLNRCEHNEQNSSHLVLVRSAGTRTRGRAAQSSPVYVPRQRTSEEVPQDIPRCRSAPPKTLPDIANLDLRTPSMVTFTSL